MTGILFCSLSAFITNHAKPTSYVIRRNDFHFWQLDEVREMCLLRLKYGYFSYKNAWIRYRRPLFTPQSCVRHLLWIHALYLTCCGLLNRNTHRNDNTWNSKDNFLYNWLDSSERKSYTQDASRVSKSQANFHFWVNLPFKMRNLVKSV